MFEKVNPSHPDKVADRIAGALVDLAYKKATEPKVAVEVLIGHGTCSIIIESSETFSLEEVRPIVQRISCQRNININLKVVQQDEHLANNQEDLIRCGDNGIFKGMPVTNEQKELSELARSLHDIFKTDGKYILDNSQSKLIVCQSGGTTWGVKSLLDSIVAKDKVIVNPLGDWTGGTDVDSGATNRKLGSDMGDAVTGGGLHGKDLSKADVSLNIYCHLKAQELGRPYSLCCAIGDETVDGKPYNEIVEIARKYINDLGGFEKFAEWGLI